MYEKGMYIYKEFNIITFNNESISYFVVIGLNLLLVFQAKTFKLLSQNEMKWKNGINQSSHIIQSL